MRRALSLGIVGVILAVAVSVAGTIIAVRRIRRSKVSYLMCLKVVEAVHDRWRTEHEGGEGLETRPGVLLRDAAEDIGAEWAEVNEEEQLLDMWGEPLKLTVIKHGEALEAHAFSAGPDRRPNTHDDIGASRLFVREGAKVHFPVHLRDGDVIRHWDHPEQVGSSHVAQPLSQ